MEHIIKNITGCTKSPGIEITYLKALGKAFENLHDSGFCRPKMVESRAKDGTVLVRNRGALKRCLYLFMTPQDGRLGAHSPVPC
jgi:hypothetical protein